MMLRTLLVLVALCTVGAFRPLLHRPVHQQLTVGPQLGRSRLLRLAESEESVLDADEPPGLVDGIVPVELNDELKASFMSYAMSTILGRALPDARDGMKPVHRRVLYAMQVLGLTPDSGYRKCARIVGEVLGKYHPHGDQSVYDALVRMAQDFVMLHPLVSGHGNFGSVDNDPPAAMRYTEARLSSLAFESLLTDIKEDTVDFLPNFDGNEEEPAVLPARLPTLLLNGASGIAVGMATNIPPHNLGELADAVIALIDKPDLDDEELFRIIPAPDFPTGGVILGAEGARKMYETGKGSVVVRAQSHMEMITSGTKAGTRTRNAIIITELPYMTNKAGKHLNPLCSTAGL
jgi:DNA gyrase subunit A